ncbi:MAG: hemophilus-specific protein [Betaproteobacteria bacterium]|nr:hemophilus-specific protein [Betaproteobacteria bacterium]
MSGAVSSGAASRGLLRIVSPSDMVSAEAADQAAEEAAALEQEQAKGVAAYAKQRFYQFRRHRSSANGWDDRLLHALRTFNGHYSPARLAEIKKFGGSEIYARVTAVKCRGATSLLRDVYLGPERAWAVIPTPDPTIPDDVKGSAVQLLATEVVSMTSNGEEIDEGVMHRRLTALLEAARSAAQKQARKAAVVASGKLDDLLTEGGFYKALAEFLVDLPLFPFAVIKGPVVRIVPQLSWKDGKPEMQDKARMFWHRVSPFDIWFTPGVNDIADAEVIERTRLTRADLNALLGLPGYSETAIRTVLDLYGRGGLHESWMDRTESERATQESKENPLLNDSNLIDCLEWHGPIQGRTLLESGFGEDFIEDPLRDYYVQAWIIGNYVIKCQLSPSPRQRAPYYVSSFEKVPGTVVGNGLPDVLEDIQDVCNAALRALVNNMAIASGPQVVINHDRMHPTENPDEMYPWKRWATVNDPLGNNNQAPVSFFQPEDNSAKLLGIYEKYTQIADELSAIPRYITGSDRMGGAGRTASGLAMLMGNASKILQTVAANIDRDVMEPLLTEMFDMVMLTDNSGLLRGDESIEVKGVSVAVQRETERQRQLEFLQITANPIDMDIMGKEGRAKVLRSVSTTVGLSGEDIIPSEEELKARQVQAQQQAMLQALGGEGAGEAQGGAPKGMAPPPSPRALSGPQTNVVRPTQQMKGNSNG